MERSNRASRRAARKAPRVGKLRRLHKQVGVFVSVFLCLLAITGIALNHSEALALDKKYVPGWIAAFYLGSTEVRGIQKEDQYLYSFGGQFFVDRAPVTSCLELQDFEFFDGQEIALCDGGLIILTPDFQVIERIDNSVGLPEGVANIQVDDTGFLVNTDSTWQSFDLLTLDLSPTEFSQAVQAPAWVPIPTEMLLGDSITWQKFILDLHSGVVIGLPGKLFADLVALLLIGMAISGVWMWRNIR
tara:strand:- start:243 stop:977 length:735 start_codon:yes stop_codon:yes gene_type:complete